MIQVIVVTLAAALIHLHIILPMATPRPPSPGKVDVHSIRVIECNLPFNLVHNGVRQRRVLQNLVLLVCSFPC